MLSEVEKRILEEAYSSTEAMENLTVLCDEYGGRFAGSEDNRAAAEFILGLYEEYGFVDLHLESFRFPGCEVISSSLEVKDPIQRILQPLTLPMTPSGEVEAEVVFVEGPDEVPDEVDGKIVLGLNRLPLARCVEAGAEGFIWMHPVPRMGPPTGVVPSKVPSISIKHEDGLLLRRLMERKGEVTARIETECRHFQRESWNVCGEVHGSGSSEEYVLLGGHYDGHEIAQAAFDCGSGCMAVTEMGRVLNEVSDRMDGGVKIVCFSAEEFGYWGSRDYAKRHEGEMRDMLFTYQLDCSGGGGPQMVNVDYWPQLEPFYRKLSEDLNLPIPFDQRMGPGDSRAFHERGIPTGSILDYREPGRLALLRTVRHTIYDTVDKINPRSLQEDAVIGAVSTLRVLSAEDWPRHRTSERVQRLREDLNKK